MAKKGANKPGPVTEDQINQRFSGVTDPDVDQEVAERTGSDDKVEAGKSETSSPVTTAGRVQTMTPAAHQRYLELVKLGMRRTGAFGPRNEEPFQRNERQNDFELRRRFLAEQANDPNRQLDVADVDELFGIDTSAPDHTTPNLVCGFCGEGFDRPFIQAARVYWKDGSLMTERDRTTVEYRGQFTTLVLKETGRLAPVPYHLGDHAYKVRDANHEREPKVNPRTKETYPKAVLLPALTYAGALARIASIEANATANRDRQSSMGERFILRNREGGGGISNRDADHRPTTHGGFSIRERVQGR